MIDDATTVYNDFWSFDIASDTWTLLSGSIQVQSASPYPSSANAPSPREFAIGGFESTSGDVILFGGDYGTGSGYQGLNDLWRFGKSSQTWTSLGGSQTSEPGQDTGSLAYPGSRSNPMGGWTAQKLILFGGQLDATASLTNDLWQGSITPPLLLTSTSTSTSTSGVIATSTSTSTSTSSTSTSSTFTSTSTSSNSGTSQTSSQQTSSTQSSQATSERGSSNQESSTFTQGGDQGNLQGSNSNSNNGGAQSNKSDVAIIVPVVIVGVLLIAGAIVAGVLLRKRMIKKQQMAETRTMVDHLGNASLPRSNALNAV
eukprot:TRINITY_DN1339_c0_g2_i1.p1 TRINITY_DN1339_c0_g2~~TRINITY_DN1339_c0_g2_i1.p1  ORF type:complete len:347 (+),score=83.58 TRINITY_DN1339_c0_g2_i1:100-1041(+)